MDDFHTSRRMFAYHDGVLFLAPRGDDRSHAEWMREMKLDFEKTTRGFARSGWLCIYIGRDFAVPANWEEVLRAAAYLAKDAKIGLGMKVATVGIQWEPLIKYSSVQQALKVGAWAAAYGGNEVETASG